ncbi:Lrp/AsnC family transcriptional regulator [Gulosibacter sp. 10]|uniref:Lrp/AsnC family transcriptional regulator n=1 Tax=Gulosibacter sp. 10 TaxID=1255570 RepID=UPI00097EF58F|nr:Lrp/AsnC family transcriptional regulator [Gulosibacter sp. 10]SJM61151.1 Transcriptional regulator, AsnC family [Gulosibacter sp. 10]
MDAIDRAMLSLLQDDGRATMTEVAAQVGLSLSACHRRFRDLEAKGVIRGFRADVDLELLGFPFEALVFVTMRAGDAVVIAEFEAGVAEIPHVVQAHRLFGEPDYQLYVAARSKQHFQELYDERLSQLPGVQRLTSTLIMKTLVAGRSPG